VAAQVAYTDHVSNPWDAVAGFNRGRVNALEIVMTTGKAFTEGERDTLQDNQINPLQMFRGEGNVIWGQMTEQKKNSALSRVNVRRLLIQIEKTLAVTLKRFVFESNSELTRFRIENLVTEYLEGLSAQGAFQLEAGDRGFHVVCNEDNNTPAVIDSNTLKIDVFIKPVRTAEYLQLVVTPTTTGTSFKELIAQGSLY